MNTVIEIKTNIVVFHFTPEFEGKWFEESILENFIVRFIILGKGGIYVNIHITMFNIVYYV